uniref:Uncharacterized protein n=1 Tax=Rhizophora mucronata TaxID=61149 RepID=A0A2P2LYX6_RHIMU
MIYLNYIAMHGSSIKVKNIHTEYFET